MRRDRHRQTDRHTDMLIVILCLLTGDEVTTCLLLLLTLTEK